jgi:DNA-binding PadR family transcriptional regulator
MADGLVEQTYDSSNKSYYRLTDDGWNEYNGEKPDEPLFSEKVEA